jgi:hypothetical protein
MIINIRIGLSSADSVYLPYRERYFIGYRSNYQTDLEKRGKGFWRGTGLGKGEG